MRPEPKYPKIEAKYLSTMLKIWKQHRKLRDASALKLLRLWLGYEFTDLMDEHGRYTALYFNELRQRLRYRLMADMLEDIKKTQSFVLVGSSDEYRDISAIFSPMWHNHEPADGKILTGSYDASSRICNCICDGNVNIFNFNTTVGNAGAFSPEGETVAEDEADACEYARTVQVRRRIVADYFLWLSRQTDADHRGLVERLMLRITRPCDRRGRPLPQYQLTEEQGREVWQVMVDQVLVPYFATREEFFRPTYMQHPERRVWWLSNLFRKWSGLPLVATRKWRYHRRSREAEEAAAHEAAQRLYRPRSPYEWEDADGCRWYDTPQGIKQQIPADAPPRPTETSGFNYIRHGWL